MTEDNTILPGRNKRRAIRVLYHLIAITLLVYSYKNTNRTIDTNSCYYLFSTIGQSLAAIIALMGTFLVFRINLIDNKLDKMESHLIDVLKLATNNIYSPLAFKKIDFNKDVAPKLSGRNNDIAIIELITDYKTINRLRKRQIQSCLFSFIYIISIILLSFIFIYVTPKLDTNNIAGTVILRLMLFCSFWAFLECCIFLWSIIKENPFSN